MGVHLNAQRNSSAHPWSQGDDRGFLNSKKNERKTYLSCERVNGAFFRGTQNYTTSAQGKRVIASACLYCIAAPRGCQTDG